MKLRIEYQKPKKDLPKPNVDLQKAREVRDYVPYLYDCTLRQKIRELKIEQQEVNGLMQSYQVAKTFHSEKVFKFRLNTKVPFKYVGSIFHQKGVYYYELQLQNDSQSNHVYFRKLDFKVFEKEVFQVSLLNRP